MHPTVNSRDNKLQGEQASLAAIKAKTRARQGQAPTMESAESTAIPSPYEMECGLKTAPSQSTSSLQIHTVESTTHGNKVPFSFFVFLNAFLHFRKYLI